MQGCPDLSNTASLLQAMKLKHLSLFSSVKCSASITTGFLRYLLICLLGHFGNINRKVVELGRRFGRDKLALFAFRLLDPRLLDYRLFRRDHFGYSAALI